MYDKLKTLNNVANVSMIILLISFCLPSVGYSQQDVKTLIEKLKTDRRSAVEALAKAGEPAVEPLIAVLNDEDLDVRWGAAIALGKIGKPAVEPLIAALKHEDSIVRWGAADALGEIKDARAVEPLIAALKDDYSIVRLHAAGALGEIKDARAVEPLIAALKDDYSIVRWHAAGALGSIGKPAVEPLIAALKDEDSDVRWLAADALGEIKDARVVELLIAALKDEDLQIVASAERFFIRRGEKGSEAILIKALEEHGSEGMAKDFLNSGNGLLSQAATKWAKDHGYTILPSFRGVGGTPAWGVRK